MSPDAIFQVANMTALSGWLLLLASPFIPRVAQWGAGIVIPLVLSIAYTGLILAFWSRAEGGFDSLANVMALFKTPEIALAGWLHYLAFDLFIGAWEVRTARRERLPFLLVVPCLIATFLFGPAGLLAFLTLRWARSLARTSPRAA